MYKGKNIIALCTSRVQDRYHSLFIRELNSRLKSMNCMLLVYNICSDLLWYSNELDWHNSVSRTDLTVFELMRPDITDAVIIMDDRIKGRSVVEKIIKRFNNADVPVMVIDGKYENTVHIGFEYTSGMRKITEHLIDEHNARRFFIIAGKEDSPFSIERVDAIMDVIKSRGIDPDTVKIGYGDFWSEPARKVTESIIESGDLPDAIVCLNDVMAISALSTLDKYRIKVPDDVIVTGFDGYNEIYITKPCLTSCICDNTYMIGCLCQAIDDAVNKNKNGKKEYVVGSSPIFLESCGCVKSRDNPFDMYDFFNNHFYRFDDEERVIAEVSSRIQTAENIEEAAACWRSNISYHMTCMINTSFMSDEFDHVRREDPFDDTMIVFSDHSKTDHTYEIRRDEIIPDIEKVFDEEKPLIFMSLEYADVPVGYVCYNFDPDNILEYNRIPNLTSVLSNSVGVFRSIRNQCYLRDKLEMVYLTDPLTGLFNRNGFKKYFGDMIERLGSENGTITSVMCDLDRLKYINDKYGHAEGDSAIRTVAMALKHSVPENALCIRFGGDEISAFIPEKTDPEKLADRMHSYFAEYNRKSDKEYAVWASIGCFVTDKKEEFSYEYLIKMADEQLYIDKEKNHKLR